MICRVFFSWILFLYLLPSSAVCLAPQKKLNVYPDAGALPLSQDYRLRVRSEEGTWTPVPVYAVPVTRGINVEATYQAARTGQKAPPARTLTSVAFFDFHGALEVEATWLHAVPRSVRLRPYALGITATLAGNTARFVLHNPVNLSLEPDGELFHNLQIFAGSPEATKPTAQAPHVLYYGPGLHEIGTVIVPSHTTVYLDGGAVVSGSFLLSHVEDVRILGRGILTSPDHLLAATTHAAPQHDAIRVEYARNVVIDGIVEMPSSYTVLVGQSSNITVRNLKSFSAAGNNDGIDVFSSQQVLIEHVFLRNSDDNIALYAHRWNYSGDLVDITVRDATLWADVAHPILVGTHGNTAHPETLEHLRFENIDILDQREPQIDYQGCMSLNAGDSNLIRDVVFDNVRIDDIRMGQLFNLRVMFNRKYNTSPGRGIENVVFRNISYNGTAANPSIIAGYDDQRAVRNVRFEHLAIRGTIISDTMPGKPGFYQTADVARIFVGEHVENLHFYAEPPNATLTQTTTTSSALP